MGRVPSKHHSINLRGHHRIRPETEGRVLLTSPYLFTVQTVRQGLHVAISISTECILSAPCSSTSNELTRPDVQTTWRD